MARTRLHPAGEKLNLVIFTGILTRTRYFEPRDGEDKKGRKRHFPPLLILTLRGIDPRTKKLSSWQDCTVRGMLAEWGQAHLQLKTRVCIIGQLVRSTYNSATTGKRHMKNQLLVREIMLHPFLRQDPSAEILLSTEVGVEFETDPEADSDSNWVVEDDSGEDNLAGSPEVDP